MGRARVNDCALWFVTSGWEERLRAGRVGVLCGSLRNLQIDAGYEWELLRTMVPEAGQRFGPYEILGKLGGGGMGIVFRAWDERLHREVAIKLLHDDYETPGMRERFLLEARAASALNHPNICTIFDIGEQDGEPYLVMEVLEGITLKQKILQGAVPVEDMVRISEEISEALAAAHAKGIVHRDIKPANIFLVRKPGGKPQAKVLDFGLAKISQASRAGKASLSVEITTAGTTVGTLAYMSPEQARGEPLDARSDLFSLGVVMYEMATRRVPFRGSTSAMVYLELLSQAPESIRQWNDTVPKELERLIFRLLAKDRSERPQTANELCGALRKIQMKGEGSWLKKAPRAAVPLVQAPDPVARGENRWKLKESSPFRPAAELEASASAESGSFDSDSGGDLIRPRRLPTRESGPRESAFRSDRGSDPVLGSASASRPKWPLAGEPNESSEVIATPRAAVRERNESGSGEMVASTPTSASASAPAAAAATPDVSALSSPGHDSVATVEEPLAIAGDAMVVVPEAAATAEPEERSEAPAEASPAVPVEVSAAGDDAEIDDFGIDDAGSGERAGKAPVESPAVRRSRSKHVLWMVAGLLAAGVIGIGLWVRGGGFGRVVLGPADSVLLTAVQNKTGDPSLDGAVMEGLEIQLAQSALRWRGQEAFRAGVRQVVRADHVDARSVSARAAALRLGARAYVYGEMTGSGAPYTISLQVLEASSNDKLASLSETAASKREVAGAIDRLAIDLRQRLGEDAASISQHQISLGNQATSSMEALSAFSEAEEARQSAHLAPAIDLYGKALREAPGFALAGVQLAWTYEGEYAELAAADAARRAKMSAGQAGDRVRTMAEVAASALDTQDFGAAGAAARRLISVSPKDATGMVALARVMGMQGHMTESLLSAEEAYRREPTSEEAYREAGRALLGLNRFDEALHLADVAKQAGGVDDTWRSAALYLGRKAARTKEGRPGEGEEPGLAAMADRALALDEVGAFEAGGEAWHAAARASQSSAGLASAGAEMLARGALDRALAGHCSQAISFAGEATALPYGKAAIFEAGLAQALCGGEARASQAMERLQRGAGLHTWAADFYVPVLRGGMAISAKDGLRAQEALSGVHQMRDEPPLASYLLGLAHLAAHHEELAVEDFKGVEAHRGYAFVTGTVAYPMAELALGRSEAAVRHGVESAASYRRFLGVWTGADHGDPLLAEASGKAP